jgi:hypothetical protein
MLKWLAGTVVLAIALGSLPGAVASGSPQVQGTKLPNPSISLLMRADESDGLNMVAVLIPFLAKLRFAQLERPAVSPSGSISALFQDPNGALIWIGGHQNCAAVAYFPMRRPASKKLKPADDAGDFRSKLDEFLESLPTPRPQARDVEWSPIAPCN